jgi:hypothetical protein
MKVQKKKSYGIGFGHESLSILIHYVLNLLSVLDPTSAVFALRIAKTCLQFTSKPKAILIAF